MIRSTIAFVSLILIVSCDSKPGSKQTDSADTVPDYEALFRIHSTDLAIGGKGDSLVFEHWTDDGWLVMHTNVIPESYSEVFPIYWMLGTGDYEVIYGLPSFRGAYRLPHGSGEIVYQGVKTNSEGHLNLFFRRTEGELVPCLRARIETTKSEQDGAHQPATRPRSHSE